MPTRLISKVLVGSETHDVISPRQAQQGCAQPGVVVCEEGASETNYIVHVVM